MTVTQEQAQQWREQWQTTHQQLVELRQRRFNTSDLYEREKLHQEILEKEQALELIESNLSDFRLQNPEEITLTLNSNSGRHIPISVLAIIGLLIGFFIILLTFKYFKQWETQREVAQILQQAKAREILLNDVEAYHLAGLTLQLHFSNVEGLDLANLAIRSNQGSVEQTHTILGGETLEFKDPRAKSIYFYIRSVDYQKRQIVIQVIF